MPYKDGHTPNGTGPREELQRTIGILENDLRNLFSRLRAATFSGNHSAEEIKRNKNAVADEIDVAVDKLAAAWKQLARM